MKTKLLKLFVYPLLLSAVMTVLAASPGDADRTVVVGYYPAPGLMNGASDSGDKSGYAYDYIQEIAKRTGWKFRYVYGSFGELYIKLQAREIDILPYVTKTPARSGEILFPKRPMGDERLYIGSLKAKRLSADLSEMQGRKVGIIKGAFSNVPFTELMSRKGIDCELVEYSLAEERTMALAGGLVDYVVELSTAYQNIGLHAVYEFGEVYPFFLAVAKGRDDLLQELDKAQEDLEHENPEFANELKQKYFNNIEDAEITAWQFFGEHLGYVYGAVITILLAFIAILLYRRRMIAKHMRELESFREKDRILSEITRERYGYNVTVNLNTLKLLVIRGTGTEGAVDIFEHCDDYVEVANVFASHIKDQKYLDQALALLSADALRKFVAEGRNGYIGSTIYPAESANPGEEGQTGWREVSLFIGANENGTPVAHLLGRNITEEHARADTEKRLMLAEQANRLLDNANKHEKLRADVLAFALANDDLERFVDFFSSRILELYGCDQVIYRDVEGRQIVKERPGIAPLDFSLCANCPHFDFDAPVYADGYTVMDDCKVGYKGIPVHCDCRVRASLTWLVHEDKKVFGYIALHYLDGTHHFTDEEKTTFDNVSKLLAVVLTRRRHIQSEQEHQQQLEKALATIQERNDRFDVVKKLIKAGLWDFKLNAADEVVSAKYSEDIALFLNLDEKLKEAGPNVWMTLVHPDDREVAFAAFNAAKADHSGRTPYDVVYRMIDKNGNYNWFHSAGSIIRHEDGTGDFYGIHINITKTIEKEREQQRLLEKALVASEKTNQQLDESNRHEKLKGDAFAFMLKNENIEEFVDFFSERILELYGCDQVIYRDIEGRQIVKERPNIKPLDFSLCANCPHFDFDAPVYADGFTAMDDCKVGYKGIPVHPDCHVRASLTYLVHEDEKVFGYIALHYLDGTHAFSHEEKNTFDRLAKFMSMVLSRRKQQNAIKTSLALAESANKAKTEFLFNMSHDIRTPMNAILGFTNMAEKHLDDQEKVKDCLAKVQQSGNLLLALINSILDMSRIEAGSAELQENPGDVCYSFSNIESALQEIAATRDVTLTFEFGEVTDRYVYADFQRCIRIFTNLIANAIKYSHEGGYVKVRCEQATPVMDGYASYRYTIEDNGIGMSEEFQKHMFETFSREHNSTTSGIQGTGLGLSVCKTFVEYMHGTIDCVSKLGEGTTFTVILPFRIQNGRQYTDVVTGEVMTAGTDAKTTANTVDIRGRKVLIVEDNELNREIAVEILEDEGLTVDEAEDGSIAVRKLSEKGPDYYDFILMDIQMPVMNGYEATKAIREMYPDARIPIIAVSANAFEEDRRASREAGMDDHVAKPVKIKELMTALSKYL